MNREITRECFRKGYEEFRKNEKRDAMYKVANFLVKYFWGDCYEMANGLGVLLLTWNQAFYRFGPFSFEKLEQWLKDNWLIIESFKNRLISSLSESDEENIRVLFNGLLDALKIVEGNNAGRKSPVAVAKALHLLAPKFSPLWDEEIASGYGYDYSEKPGEKYFSFCFNMKDMAEQVQTYPGNPTDVTLLKLIDEYNYAKYTKRWVNGC